MSLKLEKVLILDGVDSVCERILKRVGIEVTTRTKLSKEELIRDVALYDAIVVRSATKITADILEASTRLKIVGRAGTGVDNIDVTAATKKGILVMNTPGGNTISAAEHTCTLICALSRSVAQACSSLKGGAWDRKKYMGNELFGKNLAIIGLGRIGKEVSDRMKSFGMKVIGFDPIVPPETAASWGIEFHSLDEIWPLADYITVHTPLIPQTKYLINAQVLKACKPTVKIVNVARGGIVEEKALLDALNSGICGGAALDVFEEEPLKDLTLVQHPKVIGTPHLGASTVEAQTRVAEEIAEQFVSMSDGRQIVGLVNAPALSGAGNAIAQPWIKLASSLGILASKLRKPQKPSTLTVTLSGNIGIGISNFASLMSSAILKGYLQEVKNGINLVNAPALAKEIDVQIKVATSDDSSSTGKAEYNNSVNLKVESGTLNDNLSGGTVSGRPVLYSINNNYFDNGIALEKNLTFLSTSNSEEAFLHIAKSLQKFNLVSLISSAASGKEKYVVAQTQDTADINLLSQEKFKAFQLNLSSN